MLTEQHYQLLWIYYGVSGLIFLCLLWLVFRRFRRFYCRYFLMLISTFAIFIPWRVVGTVDYLAPGVASLLMSFIG